MATVRIRERVACMTIMKTVKVRLAQEKGRKVIDRLSVQTLSESMTESTGKRNRNSQRGNGREEADGNEAVDMLRLYKETEMDNELCLVWRRDSPFPSRFATNQAHVRPTDSTAGTIGFYRSFHSNPDHETSQTVKGLPSKELCSVEQSCRPTQSSVYCRLRAIILTTVATIGLRPCGQKTKGRKRVAIQSRLCRWTQEC